MTEHDKAILEGIKAEQEAIIDEGKRQFIANLSPDEKATFDKVPDAFKDAYIEGAMKAQRLYDRSKKK
jgi:hypothetical protein